MFGRDVETDFTFDAGKAGGGLVVAADEEITAAVKVFVVDVVGKTVVVGADFIVHPAAVVGDADFKIVGTLFFQGFVAVFEGVGGQVFAVVVELHRRGQALVVRGGEREAVVGMEVPQGGAGIGKRAFAVVAQIGAHAAAEAAFAAFDEVFQRVAVVTDADALPLPARSGFESEAAELELLKGENGGAFVGVGHKGKSVFFDVAVFHQADGAAFLRLLLRAEYAFQPACDWGVVELDAGVQPFVGKHGVGATFAWAAVSALRRCLSSG